MERWSGALGEVRVRRFDEIVSLLGAAAPFDFDGYINPITAFLEEAWEEKSGPNQVIGYPGKLVDYVSVNCAAYSKFMHVLDCAREEVRRGAFTWGLVDAYHATLMGARSILAAFGVLVTNAGTGRTVIVDLFPEFGSRDDQKRFLKQFKHEAFPIRVMAPTRDKLLEQSDLWALVKRIVNLRAFSTSQEEQMQQGLVEMIDARPWQGRNSVLYDVTAWKWGFDIGLSPMTPLQVDTLFLTTDQITTEFVLFIDAIYQLVEFYSLRLRGYVGGPPLSLPPNVSRAVAPNVLN